jgi:hypothetical protein
MRFLLNSIFLITMLSAMACKKEAMSSAPAFKGDDSQASDEGGVNGGGGGTLPANPITVIDVVKIVGESKKTLDPLVKFQLWSHVRIGFREGTVAPKLFDGQVTIWNVLQDTNIEILMDKPCHYANGRETDGSVHASKPGAICISAFRIAPKLIIERAPIEINALILHELSHLLGATEDEARDYQRTSADEMGPTYAQETAKGFETQAQQASENFSRSIYSVLESLDKGESEATVLKKMGDLGVAEGIFLSSSRSKFPYSIFTASEEDYYFLQSNRLLMGSLWLTSVTDKDGETLQKRLDQLFQGLDAVTDERLAENGWGYRDKKSIYKNELVSRIQSREELRSAVMSFYKMFEVTDQAIRNLSFGNQMGPVPDLNNANPWRGFVGEWKVTETDCKDPLETTGYKIIPDANDPEELELMVFWSNGYGDQGDLYDGAVNNDGTAVQVQGDANHAVRISERGDRWGHDYSQSTFEIASDGGAYTITKSFYAKTEHDYGQWKEESRHCTMKVVPVR